MDDDTTTMLVEHETEDTQALVPASGRVEVTDEWMLEPKHFSVRFEDKWNVMIDMKMSQLCLPLSFRCRSLFDVVLPETRVDGKSPKRIKFTCYANEHRSFFRGPGLFTVCFPPLSLSLLALLFSSLTDRPVCRCADAEQ